MFSRTTGRMVAHVFLIFILYAMITPLTAEPQHIGHPMVQEIRFTAEFPESVLRFEKVLGRDVIIMDGASSISNPGEPVLPVKEFSVAIPPGTGAVQVRARSLTSTDIPGTYYILPGQPPRKTSMKTFGLEIAPDDIIYRSSLPYPGRIVTLDYRSDLAGQGIIWITVYPLQYLPAEKNLILHTNVEVTVSCLAEESPRHKTTERYARFTQRQRRVFEDMLQATVVNPDDVVLNPILKDASLILPTAEYDHVIITQAVFFSAFEPLVDWHTKKGERDTVVTTGWIYNNYNGPGDTLKIRQFIMDASSNWGTMYFLLGGENSTVPFCYRSYGDGSVPSDQYYSDYDDDWTHEVFVGRVSVGSPSEATTFVDKVLMYEKSPPLIDYPLNILLIGMDADEDTPCEELKETVYSYIPTRFNVTKVYDSDTGNHETAAKAALNAGNNMVNHSDHCDWNYLGTGDFWHWWGINNAEVDVLENDNRMSIIVSDGCWPNAMDQEDCISEHLVLYNPLQAGLAFTGNTRDGYYWSGIPESLSGQLDREWWDGVFQYNQTRLGHAIIFSKHQFGNGNQDRRHCEWTFNLLGDPSMPVWLDTPGSLDVSHPTLISQTSQSFTVTVSGDGSPIEESLVCLRKNNEVYEVGTTGVSGEVTFTIHPLHHGRMDVTVTAPDYLPYEGSCRVNPSYFRAAEDL